MLLQGKYNPQQSRCLGVFNLNLMTEAEDLTELFSKYGPVEQAIIIRDHYTKRSRGFGFVYMKHEEDAVKVCQSSYRDQW